MFQFLCQNFRETPLMVNFGQKTANFGTWTKSQKNTTKIGQKSKTTFSFKIKKIETIWNPTYGEFRPKNSYFWPLETFDKKKKYHQNGFETGETTLVSQKLTKFKFETTLVSQKKTFFENTN